MKICVRNCDMNSTLGSVVPLALFDIFLIFVFDCFCAIGRHLLTERVDEEDEEEACPMNGKFFLVFLIY